MRFPAFAHSLLLASATLIFPVTAVHGFAPGGGGADSAPSMSAPQVDAAAEYRKGIEALQAKRYAEAKKAFARVLSVAPKEANTNYLAGLAHSGLGDLKGARKHYERAVKSDSSMVAARQELGVTYAKLGAQDKAQAELASLNAMAAKCGESCEKAADIKRAVAMVTAAMAQGPQARLATQPSLLFANAESGDRTYFDAVGLINERRYEDAIVKLQAAHAAFGQHPDILTYLGFANRKLGRYDVAESYYRQALKVAPDHKGATEYFGELMVERGDRAGAQKMLAKLERICTFGCAEADELRLWIETGSSDAS